MRKSGPMSENHDDAQGNPQHKGRAPIAALITPALAFGATIVARKALASGYRSVTGSDAPSGQDRSAPLGQVLAWAALSAATAAVIEVAVYRITARILDD